MNATTVRPATRDDVAAVREVGLRTWPPTYTALIGAENVERGLAQWWSPEVVLRGVVEHRTWVAERDGEVVGCAVAGERDGQRWLWKLYVLPTEHGTGAGHALVAEVLDWAGSDPVRLTCAVGNDRAHDFYLRHGFEDVGLDEDGPGPETVMERR